MLARFVPDTAAQTDSLREPTESERGPETELTNPHLDTALLALRLGFSPVPPTEDGRKAPIWPGRNYNKPR